MSSINFTAYAEKVLLHKRKEGLAASTYARYKALLGRIDPVIGGIPLDELGASDLEKLYAQLSRCGERAEEAKAKALPCLHELKAELGLSIGEISRRSGVPQTTVSAMFNGRTVVSKSAKEVAQALGKELPELFAVEYSQDKLAGKTILEHYRLVYMILERAVDDGYIPENVAKGKRPVIAGEKQERKLSVEEQRRFLKVLETEPLRWKAIVRFFMETDCVRGEIVALQWNDVDFKSASIYVKRKIVRDASGKGYRVDPMEGEKVYPISTELAHLLLEYRKEQAAVGCDRGSDYVFAQKDGSYLYPDSITGRLSKISKRSNVPLVNTYMLRKFIEK